MERKKAAGKVEELQKEFLTKSLRKYIEKGNMLQGIPKFELITYRGYSWTPKVHECAWLLISSRRPTK